MKVLPPPSIAKTLMSACPAGSRACSLKTHAIGPPVMDLPRNDHLVRELTGSRRGLGRRVNEGSLLADLERAYLRLGNEVERVIRN
jgi:hypothetical protein